MASLTKPIAVANGAISPPSGALQISRLRGFSIGETAGATAKVRIRDKNVSGQILAVITLVAGESVRDWFDDTGLVVPSEALYVEIVSGAVEGSVYIGV